MYDLNQYVLVRMEPSPTDPNKRIKKPVNSKGVVANALDPVNWMSLEDANRAAENFPGHKVAFVLTKDDPYFCLDIDDCLMSDGSDWNTVAKNLCTHLAGAYVEVSDSRKALHIWGKCNVNMLPPHRHKNIKNHLEFYTDSRFIVLGEAGAGDPEMDCTPYLANVISTYFPKKSNDSHGEDFEWTVGPVAEWSGTKDDAELIKKAQRFQSAQSAFGWKASFKQLWEKDSDALGKVWPHPENDFDGSSADASLAQHLAYWTGRDCERVLNLMWQSGLVRDKWENRPDYLTRTILNACSRQEKVDQSGQDRSPAASDVDFVKPKGGYVSPENVVDVFKGCIYVTDINEVLTPEGFLVNSDRFNTLYGGYQFPMDVGKNRISRKAWEAFTQHEMFRPPIAETTMFLPEEEPLSLVRHGNRLVANVWSPPKLHAVKGDVSKFINYLETAYPVERDRDLLLSYMAAILQFPGHKFLWAPLLQGPKGSGKSFIAECIVEALGFEHCHFPKSAQLADKNNGWVYRKLFAKVDEFNVSSREDLDVVKNLITEKKISIEDKWVKQTSGQNFVNFMFTTNHVDAVRIDDNERRFCPFQQAQKNVEDLIASGLTPAFWRDIYNWLEAKGPYQGQERGFDMIAHYLLTYPINEEFNPAGNAVRAPHSSTWEVFTVGSAGMVEQEIIELIQQDAPGFAGGWVSSMALDRFLTSRKLHTRVPQNRRREMMESLGYQVHPGLKNGRATVKIYPDDGRPRLYIKKGHLSENFDSPSAICKAYEDAQNSAAVPGESVFGQNKKG